MSKSVTIQLQSVPLGFPAYLAAENGSVYFDLPAGFNLSKSKNEESVSRFNAVSGEGVLGFSVPISDRNRAVLGCYAKIGSVVATDDVVIPVIAIEQGYVLRQNAIRFSGRTDGGNEYEVELIDSEEFWKTALEAVTLDQLGFGSFDLTEANLLDNWQNAATYQDGDQGVYFPLINYGNWFDPATYNEDGELTATTTVSVEDFRPLFHVLPVLQKMFEKVGWSLESPILETDLWRSRGAYIGIDYEGGPALSGFNYRAEVQSDYLIQGGNGPNPVDDTFSLHALEVFDNPDVYEFDANDPGLDYYYALGLCGRFTCTVFLKTEVSVNSIINIDFAVKDSGGLVSSQTQQVGVIAPGGENLVVSQPIDLEADQRLVVVITVANGLTPATHKVLKGSYVFNTPISVGICEDMTLPLDAYIRDYPALDFLAGILHIIGGGRVVTNFSERKVHVYHPFRTDIPGEPTVVEAYYLTPDKAEDITLITQCDSLVLTRSRVEVPRYYRLGFESQDDYLESLGYSKDNPAFAHVEDFGERLNNDFEDDNNPFFQATGEIESKDITPTGTENGVLIPAMWDDDNRTRFSTDIGPRIINFHGYIEQHVSEVSKRQWVFKSNTVTQLPFSYLESYAYIGVGLEAPQLSLAYGGIATDNSYELYWKNELAALLRDRSIDFTALIDQCFFIDKAAFRKPYGVNYRGEPLLFLLKEISDFVAGEDTLTQLSFALYPVISELFDQSPGVLNNLWLLEDGTGFFELEDASGFYELE